MGEKNERRKQRIYKLNTNAIIDHHRRNSRQPEHCRFDIPSPALSLNLKNRYTKGKEQNDNNKAVFTVSGSLLCMSSFPLPINKTKLPSRLVQKWTNPVA